MFVICAKLFKFMIIYKCGDLDFWVNKAKLVPAVSKAKISWLSARFICPHVKPL